MYLCNYIIFNHALNHVTHDFWILFEDTILCDTREKTLANFVNCRESPKFSSLKVEMFGVAIAS